MFLDLQNTKKATYGLGYKPPLTRNKDEAVLDKAAGIGDARIKNDHIHWNVPHYTSFLQEQGILSEQILSKTPTELEYIERSVLMKEVRNPNLSIFDLGSQESTNVPIWIAIGFQLRERQDSQNLNIDTFCRLPVTSAQCVIGTEKNPDASIILSFDDDEYSQVYGQIKEALTPPTKYDILQPYISDHDFSSSIRMLGLKMLVITYTSLV